MIEHESVTIWGQAPVWWLPACNLSPSQHICLCVSFSLFQTQKINFSNLVILLVFLVGMCLKVWDDYVILIHKAKAVLWAARPSRILGQGYSQAGTFWCVILRHKHGSPTNLLWCKKRYVTNTGPQLTSFGAKTVTWRTQGPNRPPLMQKTLHDEHGPWLTSFGAKKITWRTRGPNRPFICLDIMGEATIHAWWHLDLQGYTKRFGFVTEKGPETAFFDQTLPQMIAISKQNVFFVVSGCTKRQILRIHPPKSLVSKDCKFVIIVRFVARF